MSELLIELAQRAEQDKALCAGLIRNYSRRHGMQWDEMASHLGLDRLSLAKLALCQLPQPATLPGEVDQIASYLGVEKNRLFKFFQANLPSVTAGPYPARRLNVTLKKPIIKRYSWALAAIAMILVIGALFAFQPQSSTATLVVIEGPATVARPGSETQTVASLQALYVKSGDLITLGPGASAQLRLIDGSAVDLNENTQIEVTELETNANRYRVGLRMFAGRTVSRVLKALSVGDAFQIHTPSSTISVRGTVFTVQVINQTTTYIACAKGVVQVDSDGQQALVNAGQELTAILGQPLQVKPQSGQGDALLTEEGQPAGANTPESSALLASENPTPPPTVVPPLATPMPKPTVVLSSEQLEALGETPEPSSLQPSTSKTPKTPNSPNSPSQVPGSPPSVVPGSGNPPSGGGQPPGQGGEPPGQTKDKIKEKTPKAK